MSPLPQQFPTFDQRIQIISAKLRGAYLDMCGDLEFALVDIAVVCLIKDHRERKAIKEVLLENAYMSKKITMAESALKRHNIGYYNQFKVCFDKFRELTGWRNKFAHSRITGDEQEKDLSFIIFHYIKDGEMKQKPENVSELTNKLSKYAAYIRSLANLIPVLYKEQYIAHSCRSMTYSSNISILPENQDNRKTI
ncbi:hypothetical protein [Terrimonas alba]|uniref:hypothetical protein n=1 Tax=Terrimonas alba TaxID=3349636 RepID=UPI0035F27EE8